MSVIPRLFPYVGWGKSRRENLSARFRERVAALSGALAVSIRRTRISSPPTHWIARQCPQHTAKVKNQSGNDECDIAEADKDKPQNRVEGLAFVELTEARKKQAEDASESGAPQHHRSLVHNDGHSPVIVFGNLSSRATRCLDSGVPCRCEYGQRFFFGACLVEFGLPLLPELTLFLPMRGTFTQ